MKKQLLFSLLIIRMSLSAQLNTQNTPLAPTDGSINYGDTYKLTLTNTTDHSITVEALLNRAGHENILGSKQKFLDFLKTNRTGQPLITKQDSVINAGKNIAWVDKSELHENSNLLMYNWGSVYQNSVLFTPTTFTHSLKDVQCLQQSEEAARLLFETGLVDSTLLSIVTLTDSLGSGHIALDVMPDGNNPIKMDFDRRQPSFMQTDNTSVTGYMSCSNIRAHPERLTERYLWEDSVELCPEVTLEHNAGYYHDVYYGSVLGLGEGLADILGSITLAPGQSITWSFQVEELHLDLSMVDAQQLYEMEPLWIQAMSGDSVAADSLAEFISQISGTPFDLVRQAMLANKVTTDSIGRFYDEYYTQNGNGKPCRVALLETNIPASSTVKTLGNGGDISSPHLIHEFKSYGGPVTFLGNTIPVTTSGFICEAYDTSDFGTPGRHAPVVPDSLVQSLGLPGVVPANVSIYASMYFNSSLYNMFRGIKFEYIGTDSLTITTNIIKAGTVVPTAMRTPKQDVTVTIFPNPAKDVITIKSNKPIGQIDVYDIVGKKVLSQTGSNVVKVDQLVAGIYVVDIDNHYRKKIIVQ